MTELLTAAQMRAIEQAAIASGSATGLDLMERAGRGVVEAVFAQWPELAAGSFRAVVLCGPGNNGGDGFVVARVLKEWGWDVDAFLYGDAAKLPPDARANYARWCEMGAVAQLGKKTLEDVAFPGQCALVVDALFGTGLVRPVDLPLGALECTRKDRQTHRIVAVDLPSGICSDSGRVIGSQTNVVNADLTVTFHRAKLGHYLAQGASASGIVTKVDIGLEDIGSAPERAVSCIDGPSAGLAKAGDSHKFSHGHALVLSGSQGKTGAARLAAHGALRVGAGLVTVGAPSDALADCAAHLTAVMLTGVQDGQALDHVLQDGRINGLCLGPGLGLDRAPDMVQVALGGVDARAMVLDADALTAIAVEPALFEMLHDKCILTPHAGEFARLFPDIAEKLITPASIGPAFSKVDATREAAKRAGCVVLFKGPNTVIAAPDGQCCINPAINDRAAPWLATAGSGDVLAGFITGLLARGFTPMQAAQTGAWLHVECALSFGAGLIAEDIANEIPKVFKRLGL